MKSAAKLSGCRNYRFALWRTWDNSEPFAMIIGLNPSTADEVEDDPTLTRCINFAKSWGYGGGGVAAWGNDGSHLNRSSVVTEMLPDLHYLKMNKSGEPAHPLYLKADLTPVAMDT